MQNASTHIGPQTNWWHITQFQFHILQIQAYKMQCKRIQDENTTRMIIPDDNTRILKWL